MTNKFSLMENIPLRKKLPDLRMIIDNPEIFNISICLIFYSLYFSNTSETTKITDFLTLFFRDVYNIEVRSLVKYIFSGDSQLESDRGLNYNEILFENIRNKNLTDTSSAEKYYTFDKLTQCLVKNAENGNNDNNSDISLTPSLQSQDSGRTYKETIIREEHTGAKGDVPFYPVKSGNSNLLYGNENCYVLVRYIFCIYERLTKVTNI
jgi:hypothetical protein